MANVTMNALDMLKKDHETVKKLFQEYEKLASKSPNGKKKLAEQICDELTVHSTLEKEIFYPAVGRNVNEAKLLISQAMSEHAGVEDIVSEISNMSEDDEEYDERMEELMEEVLYHVEEEEEELFPMVKKSKIDLDEIGEQMARRKEELEGKE